MTTTSPIPLPRDPERILIIKPSALGDIVHTLPVLSLLRRRYPSADIRWLVMSSFAGLLEGHPQLNGIIRFERRGFRLGKMWSLARTLREGKFELVIDFQGLLRSGWLAGLTRSPVRIGFANARELAPLFYTHRVDVGGAELHATDRYLMLARAVRCEVDGPLEYVFPTDDGDRDAVRRMLMGEGGATASRAIGEKRVNVSEGAGAPTEGKGADDPSGAGAPPQALPAPRVSRYVVLLPGTNWDTKRWPIEHFAKLVGPLRERFGLKSVIAGGADATALAPQVDRSAIDLTGKTSLRQLVALLQGADLVIANDSGPMHIAAALGRPLVTMFGPTNPVRTGPYKRPDSVVRIDLPCSPCYSRHCSHTSCMRWLTVEPVLAAAEREMKGNEKS